MKDKLPNKIRKVLSISLLLWISVVLSQSAEAFDLSNAAIPKGGIVPGGPVYKYV